MTLALFIIGMNVAYVTVNTLRMIFVIKGRRLAAAGLSMLEVFIYLKGLDIVLGHLDKPLQLFAYCLGFGLGIYAGSKVEEWLALGYSVVQVILDGNEAHVERQLREARFGVTAWTANGRDGPRLVMQVLVKRSNEGKLMRHLKEWAPKAFIVSYEPRQFQGGFWVKWLK